MREGIKAWLIFLLIMGGCLLVALFVLCALHNSGHFILGNPHLCARPMVPLLITFPLEYIATITRVVSALFR